MKMLSGLTNKSACLIVTNLVWRKKKNSRHIIDDIARLSNECKSMLMIIDKYFVFDCRKEKCS